MKLGTFLRLGRISNLPTVWTNALAGAVLAAGEAPDLRGVLLAGLALTLFYEGGMWLNDAFDAKLDARDRPDRPIPQGEISQSAVFAGGGALLAAGVAVAFTIGNTAGSVGLAICVAVLLYDWLHKNTVFSPILMGLARFLSYLLGSAAAGEITGAVLLGAFGLFAQVVGLTYAAKQEAYDRLGAVWPLAVLGAPLAIAISVGHQHVAGLFAAALLAAVTALALHRLVRRAKGDVPFAVVTLIAGIALYDAALIGGVGMPGLSALAIGGFALTLLMQKVASGT